MILMVAGGMVLALLLFYEMSDGAYVTRKTSNNRPRA